MQSGRRGYSTEENWFARNAAKLALAALVFLVVSIVVYLLAGQGLARGAEDSTFSTSFRQTILTVSAVVGTIALVGAVVGLVRTVQTVAQSGRYSGAGPLVARYSSPTGWRLSLT